MFKYKYIFSVFLMFSLFAQKSKNTLKRQKLAQERIYLQQIISKNNTVLNKNILEEEITAEKLEQLNGQIKNRAVLISNISNAIGSISNDIDSGTENISELEKNLSSIKKEYALMIQYAFKNRMYYSDVTFIFAAEDFRQAYKRLKYISQHAEVRKGKVEKINAMKINLSNKNKNLKNDLLSKQGLIMELEVQKVAMVTEISQQEEWLKLLTQKNAVLKKVIEAKVEHAKYIENQINKIVSQELNYLYSAVNTKNEKPNTLAFEKMKGKLENPVVGGTITAHYGNNSASYNPNLKTYNNGVDISSSKNAKALSLYEGYVVKIVTLSTQNKAVFIRHGQYFTIYSNLNNTIVKEGQKIKTKQILGTIAPSMVKEQSELHLEIWNNKQKYDPEQWINF